jgi:hypothetical protein
MSIIKFTEQQIANQSKNNLSAYIILTIAYLKENNQSVDDWLTFIGNKFVKDWPSDHTSLEKLAEGIILNNLSAGAKLVSYSQEDGIIEIILTDWPSKIELEFYKISWEDSQLIHNVLKPVFHKLAVNYTWRIIENKQVKIELSQLK